MAEEKGDSATKKHGPNESSIVVLLLVGGCIVLGIGLVGDVQIGGYGLPHKLMIGVGGAMIVWSIYRLLTAIGQDSKSGPRGPGYWLASAGIFIISCLVIFSLPSNVNFSFWVNVIGIGIGLGLFICGSYLKWKAAKEKEKEFYFGKTGRESIHAGVFMLGMGSLLLFLKLSDLAKSSWQDYGICGCCIVLGVAAIGSGMRQKSREAATESESTDEPAEE